MKLESLTYGSESFFPDAPSSMSMAPLRVVVLVLREGLWRRSA